MNISEMIKLLTDLRDQHGEQAIVFGCGVEMDSPVVVVEYDNNEQDGPAIVLE